MKRILPENNIFSSFRRLTGNTRISVMFQPMWGIPYMLSNFYLSLYMKELGVTDGQLGYLISLTFICGTFFALIGGHITDRLGRKKATMIFDTISWPFSLLIYLLSNSFVMFAFATIAGSAVKVIAVCWNMMVVEDSDNEQRVAAYNLVNIINISAGIFIPVTGIFVNAYGVITSERLFLAISVISMTTMVFTRNLLYKETSNGQRILDEMKKNPKPFSFKDVIPLKAAAVFRGNPRAIIAAVVYVLFFIYIPLGSFNSLYFAPFMTEVLDLGKSSVSLLGGAYSAVMLAVFVFVVPVISRSNNNRNMQVGFAVQAASLLMLIMIPDKSLFAAVLSIGLYAVGFGAARPFIDAMLAEVSEGVDRASVYSLINTITCILTAAVGLVSGTVYIYDPRLIYVVSVLILAVCIALLGVYRKLGQPKDNAGNTGIQ